ncbi:MAG: hypothetical protein K0R80_3111 [Clostridia bacterium]|nr:hypothetical protein [Clostridia bacterium]
MNSLFEKYKRYSIFRAAIVCIIGTVLFFFPEFLLSDIVYIISGYTIFNGILSIADYFFREKTPLGAVDYARLIFVCLLIIFGILLIVCFRYHVSILPVYWDVLMMIESIVYFVIVLCADVSTKPILIILTEFILIGGLIANIFTFGFGGVLMLLQIFGTLLLLWFANELIFCLIYQGLSSNNAQRGEMI